MNKTRLKRYFAMALDPIHIGTGGYQLGRVDNAIVREPGTDIPKIPGSTLNGTIRTYSYYTQKKNQDVEDTHKLTKACGLGKIIEREGEPDITPCGECPVCKVFGYSKGQEGSKKGKVHFKDARILFFPVHSLIGPVWVTSSEILGKLQLNDIITPNSKEQVIITDQIANNHQDLSKLNLGWLYLDIKNSDMGETTNTFTSIEQLEKIPLELLEKIVVVHDDIFDNIVNSNLEVRTSVAIDPETGAAEEGALFTYEAIPRATVFWFDIITKNGNLPSVVKKGLQLCASLGVGGMTTRGFGRLRVWGSMSQGEGND